MEVLMYCGTCGKKLKQAQFGAYYACCNQEGYLSDIKPLPKDSWYPILKVGKLNFYHSETWPWPRRPTLPKEN
jgi:NADH pyrophosphatase NudC (nudix superfamily)